MMDTYSYCICIYTTNMYMGGKFLHDWINFPGNYPGALPQDNACTIGPAGLHAGTAECS